MGFASGELLSFPSSGDKIDRSSQANHTSAHEGCDDTDAGEC
jgi:hypothetical protein